eukprot:TRINITY_DN96793_c0_g1_i1.p1 TRINITY_DN96793_c0_g1~~TRINITY_DN96793_c0_g1_i1.p1  ORF type:complete len:381 (-),score=63.23 TRINITY_DN96793_c0_g1_i1:143-1261(-)
MRMYPQRPTREVSGNGRGRESVDQVAMFDAMTCIHSSFRALDLAAATLRRGRRRTHNCLVPHVLSLDSRKRAEGLKETLTESLQRWQCRPALELDYGELLPEEWKQLEDRYDMTFNIETYAEKRFRFQGASSFTKQEQQAMEEEIHRIDQLGGKRLPLQAAAISSQDSPRSDEFSPRPLSPPPRKCSASPLRQPAAAEECSIECRDSIGDLVSDSSPRRSSSRSRKSSSRRGSSPARPSGKDWSPLPPAMPVTPVTPATTAPSATPAPITSPGTPESRPSSPKGVRSPSPVPERLPGLESSPRPSAARPPAKTDEERLRELVQPFLPRPKSAASLRRLAPVVQPVHGPKNDQKRRGWASTSRVKLGPKGPQL